MGEFVRVTYETEELQVYLVDLTGLDGTVENVFCAADQHWLCSCGGGATADSPRRQCLHQRFVKGYRRDHGWPKPAGRTQGNVEPGMVEPGAAKESWFCYWAVSDVDHDDREPWALFSTASAAHEFRRQGDSVKPVEVLMQGLNQPRRSRR